MKSETIEKEAAKEPRLAIPGKLPFEDYASAVKMADLLKILVNKDFLSVEDYELLVMRGFIFPLVETMTQDNWMEIKAQLLEFLDPNNWQRESSDESGSEKANETR
jgi:hypothetical protein